MSFNRSVLLVIPYQPYRVDANGNVLQTLDGVFVLLSDELVDALKTNLTQAQKNELSSWLDRRTEAQCATWHMPMWAGQTSAVYLRIPANIWNSPTDDPPAKVKNYFQNLYREAMA